MLAISEDNPTSGAVGQFSVTKDTSGNDLTQDQCSGVSVMFCPISNIKMLGLR